MNISPFPNKTIHEVRDALTVLSALEKNNFNLGLTAEQLNTDVSELLVNLGPEHEQTILTKMRLRISLEQYQLWNDTKLIFVGALADAKPGEIIKAFNDMTAAVERLFSQPQAAPVSSTHNATLVLQMLPDQARNDLLNEIEKHQNTLIINQTPIPTYEYPEDVSYPTQPSRDDDED